MDQFGGDRTKIEILVDRAKGYLAIMAKRKFSELCYFDGFAGSGLVENDRATGEAATNASSLSIFPSNVSFVMINSNDMYLFQPPLYFIDDSIRESTIDDRLLVISSFTSV